VFSVIRFAASLVLVSVLNTGCGSSSEPASTGEPAETPPAPGTVTRGDASTDLDTTPISAADYAMYSAIMGGASAMLNALSPEDREALELAKRVAAGAATATVENERLLARARTLRQKDVEIARLQGIEERYVKVKAKIEAVIGPNARPPADPIAEENLRYLEAHRDNIERLQKIVRDPLSRPAQN
jgi:hypothetical protein